MDYTVIKTHMTYSEFKECFEKSIRSNLMGMSANQINDTFVGYMKQEKFQFCCSMTKYRGGNNHLEGVIIEEEDGCRILYKMQKTPNYYKAGYFFMTLIPISFLFLSYGIRFLPGIIILDIGIFLFAMTFLDMRVEAEKCCKKIEGMLKEC